MLGDGREGRKLYVVREFSNLVMTGTLDRNLNESDLESPIHVAQEMCLGTRYLLPCGKSLAFGDFSVMSTSLWPRMSRYSSHFFGNAQSVLASHSISDLHSATRYPRWRHQIRPKYLISTWTPSHPWTSPGCEVLTVRLPAHILLQATQRVASQLNPCEYVLT